MMRAIASDLRRDRDFLPSPAASTFVTLLACIEELLPRLRLMLALGLMLAARASATDIGKLLENTEGPTTSRSSMSPTSPS